MGKFFTVEIKPTMPIATQIEDDKTDMVFGANDVVFDWMAFDIPKGAAKLTDIQCIWRGSLTPKGLEFYFAKSMPDTPGTAPDSIGTGNATAGGTGYYKNIIGVVDMVTTDFRDTTLDNLTVGNTQGTQDNSMNIVLEGTPDSGTNVGYDKLYVAATVTAGSGWNTSTGVLADGAVTLGAASNFDVKTVSALNFFDVGDVVHVHDSETAIGTVKSLTATNIVLEAATGVAIADEDEIMNINPIKLVLSFEK